MDIERNRPRDDAYMRVHRNEGRPMQRKGSIKATLGVPGVCIDLRADVVASRPDVVCLK